MYKQIKISKYRIAVEKFPKTAYGATSVHKTGIRNWEAMDSSNYSIVLWLCRIIFSIEKQVLTCCSPPNQTSNGGE